MYAPSLSQELLGFSDINLLSVPRFPLAMFEYKVSESSYNSWSVFVPVKIVGKTYLGVVNDVAVVDKLSKLPCCHCAKLG